MSEHGGSGSPEWPQQPPNPGAAPPPPQPSSYEPPPVAGGYGDPVQPNYAPPPNPAPPNPQQPQGHQAPWGQTPPGQASVPPPPVSSSSGRNWLKIIGICVLAGIALIGGCTYIVIRAVSGPIDAANEFLADVAAEDFDAALDHLDPSCFSEPPSTDGLIQLFGRGLESYNLNSSQNSNNLSGSSSGSITREGFGEQPITFQMSRPFEEWLVCGIRIGNDG